MHGIGSTTGVRPVTVTSGSSTGGDTHARARRRTAAPTSGTTSTLSRAGSDLLRTTSRQVAAASSPGGTVGTLRDALGTSPTGSRILEEMDRSGATVSIVSDKQFASRYGAGAGVAETTNGTTTITFPASSVADARSGAVLLAHEAVHAIDEARTSNLSSIASEVNAYRTAALVAKELGVPDPQKHGTHHESGRPQTDAEIERAVRADPLYDEQEREDRQHGRTNRPAPFTAGPSATQQRAPRPATRADTPNQPSSGLDAEGPAVGEVVRSGYMEGLAGANGILELLRLVGVDAETVALVGQALADAQRGGTEILSIEVTTEAEASGPGHHPHAGHHEHHGPADARTEPTTVTEAPAGETPAVARPTPEPREATSAITGISPKGLTAATRRPLALAQEMGLALISGKRPQRDGHQSDHTSGNAIDVANVPGGSSQGSPEMAQYAEAVRTAARNGEMPDAKYVIYKGRIASASKDWEWRPFTPAAGRPSTPTERHDDHVHVSVKG